MMFTPVNVPPSLEPSITRFFAGRTSRDADVDALALPHHPALVRLAVLALRWYRRIRPPAIGQRCVWDPSCSRYAELAIRRRGVIGGALATAGRLARCRPGRGGVDVP